MKAFVISLPQAEERRKRFFNSAEAHGWDVELFRAISPLELTCTEISGDKRRIQGGSVSLEVDRRPDGEGFLSSAEIACAMSHLTLWRRLSESAESSFFIFEDDAIIERPPGEVLISDDWDFVFHHDRVSVLLPENVSDRVRELWLSNNSCAPLVPGCGMEAYAVTRNGALRALQIFRHLSLPIDLQLMANGAGTHQAKHNLASYGSGELQLMVTTKPIARCDDQGISFIRGDGKRKLHFGSGGLHIPGWLTCDLPTHDIRSRLNFESGSVDFIVAEHVIEHVTPREAWDFLNECWRTLRPGGVLRLAFPDLRRIAEAREVYHQFIKDRMEGDGSPKGSVRSTLFCHGHHGAWTEDSLGAVMQSIGYQVRRCRPGHSEVNELKNIEQHWKTVGVEINDIETSVLEAVRPTTAPQPHWCPGLPE